MSQKILVTGAAGFIGFHLTKALLERGDEVIGIDNINDYYDVNLKYARLNENGIQDGEAQWHTLVQSNKYINYRFVRMNLEDKPELMALANQERFDVIINLAAQAGVRYSIENPDAYGQSNLIGFLNILEIARHYPVKHLVYASSSSVYGLNERMPFSVEQNVNHPVSLYAATKKSNELMAHAYSHLYNIPTTGLRFFTVYGPWGRPDMAYFLFAEAIRKGESIKVFNHGKMERDFTYINDIINGIVNVVEKPAQSDNQWDSKNPNPSSSRAPYRIYNIGNNKPIKLLTFIEAISNAMGKTPVMDMQEMQSGDVVATWAEISELVDEFAYSPTTPLQNGIDAFVTWYNSFIIKTDRTTD